MKFGYDASVGDLVRHGKTGKIYKVMSLTRGNNHDAKWLCRPWDAERNQPLTMQFGGKTRKLVSPDPHYCTVIEAR